MGEHMIVLTSMLEPNPSNRQERIPALSQTGGTPNFSPCRNRVAAMQLPNSDDSMSRRASRRRRTRDERSARKLQGRAAGACFRKLSTIDRALRQMKSVKLHLPGFLKASTHSHLHFLCASTEWGVGNPARSCGKRESSREW